MEDLPYLKKKKTGGGVKRSPLVEIPHFSQKTNEYQLENPAVFPELPSPLKRIYLSVNDLNKARTGRIDPLEGLGQEELKPKTAVEVGLKFSF